MAECGQLPKSVVDALASALVKDADGNVSINLFPTFYGCDELTPFIDCDNNHVPSDALLGNAIGEDDCGNPVVNVNLPLSEDDEYIPDPKFGSVDGYTTFSVDGHQEMVGDARPWRDELGDALSIKSSGAGISIDLTESVVNFDFNAAYNANPALADFLYKNVQLNHDRDLTSTIDPHIHWLQAKDYSPNFLLQYRWQINGGQKTTAWTFLKCNVLTFPYTVGQVIHQISHPTAAIVPPAGTNLSDIIQFRIYRDTTNASGEFVGVTDPYNTGGNASAGVLSFDIHFMTNSIGSNEEYIK